MSVQKRGNSWRVRWQDGDRWRSRTFDLKRDALMFDSELRRHRRLGSLSTLDAGTESLDQYVSGVWAPTYAMGLAAKTRALYTMLYDLHIAPTLGSVALRQLNAEQIARWQADRLAAGAGPSSVAKARTLLSGILQRAHEAGRIQSNPARLVRKPREGRREEVRPLAPSTIERMRAASLERDSTLIAVMAYAGLRPGEALGLRWGDVRDKTLLIERAVSLGQIKTTKTGERRTVRLLAPLAADLRAWKMRSGRPSDTALVFPSRDGGPWSEPAWQNWRRRAFARALEAAGVEHARPYDLRHSFASLLLHEGRSVIYVARQLGHGAQLTLGTYGHVMDELEDSPRQDAEAAILAARSTRAAHTLPIAAR